MTKAELIKKIAQFSGVPDSEARLFFEVFLRKLESHLNLKQSFGISGVGYFELKKDYKSRGAGLDVICFSEYKESEEKLIFYFPNETEQYNSLDSYFSFSLGKPVIPLEGVKNNEFFIPHSRIEYEKLLESKVEKLLAEVEITKVIEEPLKQQSLPEKEFRKLEKKEINWKSIPSSLKERPGDEFEEQTIDQDTVSWDFGEDFEDKTEDDSNKPVQISKQDLEDKKINTASVIAEELKEKEEIIDNPPEDSAGIIEPTEQIEQAAYEAAPEAEKITKEIEKINEPVESNEYSPSNLEEIKPTLFSIDDYEKVEPIIASSLKEEEEYVSEEKKSLNREEENPEEKENIVDEEGYTRVIPRIASLLRMKEGEQEKLESPVSMKDIPSEENISDENIYDKEAIDETSDLAAEKTRSKSWRTIIIISILALVVITGGIYLYNYFFTGKKLVTKDIPHVIRDKSHAVIIERSYDYPVTYPYNKNTIVGLFDGINPDLIKTAIIEKQQQGSNAIPETGTFEARPSKFVKGYIYQYDNFYAVQVSSWKSLSIAQSEMLKYKNSGLNSFIEEAQVKGSRYYRVRIGFKSLEEVEAYLAK